MRLNGAHQPGFGLAAPRPKRSINGPFKARCVRPSGHEGNLPARYVLGSCRSRLCCPANSILFCRWHWRAFCNCARAKLSWTIACSAVTLSRSRACSKRGRLPAAQASPALPDGATLCVADRASGLALRHRTTRRKTRRKPADVRTDDKRDKMHRAWRGRTRYAHERNDVRSWEDMWLSHTAR